MLAAEKALDQPRRRYNLGGEIGPAEIKIFIAVGLGPQAERLGKQRLYLARVLNEAFQQRVRWASIGTVSPYRSRFLLRCRRVPSMHGCAASLLRGEPWRRTQGWKWRPAFRSSGSGSDREACSMLHLPPRWEPVPGTADEPVRGTRLSAGVRARSSDGCLARLDRAAPTFPALANG